MAERKPTGPVRCAKCGKPIKPGEPRVRTTPDLRTYHQGCYRPRRKT